MSSLLLIHPLANRYIRGKKTNIFPSSFRISMLRDAEFFHSRIGKLDGAKDLAEYIINIINQKPIAAPPQDTSSTAIATTTTTTNDVPPETAEIPIDQVSKDN